MVRERTYPVVIAMVAAMVEVACGASQPTAVSTVTSSAPSAIASVAVSAASPSPSTVSNTLFVLSPENGSQVGGTVEIQSASNGETLTISVKGLTRGESYVADADPLPCDLFVGGPSQSFASQLNADNNENATVRWTVPAGMAGNANVQSVTSQGSFVVVACADLG